MANNPKNVIKHEVYARLQHGTSEMQMDLHKEHESIVVTKRQSKKLFAEQELRKELVRDEETIERKDLLQRRTVNGSHLLLCHLMQQAMQRLCKSGKEQQTANRQVKNNQSVVYLNLQVLDALKT